MRKTVALTSLAPVLVLAAFGAWGAHAGAARAPAAARFPPVTPPTTARKVDEYGAIRWGDEQARLDNYVIELRNDPTARACIICYGGRKGRAGEARRRCARAADYLKRAGRIDAARIITLDGGFRERLTVELWTPPAGTTLPAVSPTVDPSEVTIIKDAPRRKRPRRAAARRR